MRRSETPGDDAGGFAAAAALSTLLWPADRVNREESRGGWSILDFASNSSDSSATTATRALRVAPRVAAAALVGMSLPWISQAGGSQYPFSTLGNRVLVGLLQSREHLVETAGVLSPDDAVALVEIVARFHREKRKVEPVASSTSCSFSLLP